MTPTKPEDALVEQIERLNDWLAETQMRAHNWMVAHDRLKAGKPYDLPQPADLPDAITTLLERERRKDEALRELGKCGSCGGSGKYLNKWITGGGTGTGEYHEEFVQCTKCEGSGINQVARAALTGEGD